MGSELYAYGLLAIPMFAATLIALFFRRSGGIAAGFLRSSSPHLGDGVAFDIQSRQF